MDDSSQTLVASLASNLESFHMQSKNRKRIRRDSNKTKELAGFALNHNQNGNSSHIAVRGGKLGDRKSRSVYGRGLPKKGGAGGKGTWGRLGDEISQTPFLDDHDPNYDSEELDEITYKTLKPVLTDEQVDQEITPILREYFENTDIQEAIVTSSTLNVDGKKHMILVCLVTMAMEMKNEFRQLASELIKAFATPKYILKYGNTTGWKERALRKFEAPFLSSQNITKGFVLLSENLQELMLDTPDATEVLGKFLARAISDQTTDENILDQIVALDSRLADECVHEAKYRLSQPIKVKHIWGEFGAIQPLEVLKKKMMILLKEYILSGDSEEAMRCVRELDVPHFNHELVYEMVIMAMENATEQAISMLVYLLKRFSDTTVLTSNQISEGFKRVYDEMPDISIDVPNAYLHLEHVVDKCYHLKIIDMKLRIKAPNKSRKRFVSEGDRGKLNNYTCHDRFFDC